MLHLGIIVFFEDALENTKIEPLFKLLSIYKKKKKKNILSRTNKGS